MSVLIDMLFLKESTKKQNSAFNIYNIALIQVPKVFTLFFKVTVG